MVGSEHAGEGVHEAFAVGEDLLAFDLGVGPHVLFDVLVADADARGSGEAREEAEGEAGEADFAAADGEASCSAEVDFEEGGWIGG